MHLRSFENSCNYYGYESIAFIQKYRSAEILVVAVAMDDQVKGLLSGAGKDPLHLPLPLAQCLRLSVCLSRCSCVRVALRGVYHARYQACLCGGSRYANARRTDSRSTDR